MRQRSCSKGLFKREEVMVYSRIWFFWDSRYSLFLLVITDVDLRLA